VQLSKKAFQRNKNKKNNKNQFIFYIYLFLFAHVITGTVKNE